MRLLILLTFIGMNTVVLGQQWQAENLKRQIAVLPNDTAKANSLAELSYLYTNIDTDSAILIAQNGISLAKDLRYKRGEAYCLVSLGRAYMHFGNSDLALEKMIDALTIFEKLKIQNGKGLAMVNIALVYAYLQNTPLSLNYTLQAKKIAEEIKDSALLVISLLKLCDSYGAENKTDTILKLANTAKSVSIALRDTLGWARSLAYIGMAYAESANKPSGLYYKQESLRLDLAIGNNRGAAQNYLGIAGFYAAINNIDSALYFANKSLDLAKKHHFAFIEISVLSKLSSLFEGKNDKEALRYYKMYGKANDSFYSVKKTQQIKNIELKQQAQIREEEIAKKAYRNRVIQFVLAAGLAVFLLTALVLYRNNRHKQKVNKVLATTLTNLKSTQSQLIQSEKMASLGELTAGIAHEIQNPLNFVNNFSEVNTELIDEMKVEMDKGNIDDAKAIANDIKENEQKINHHGKRADAIVKGMLQHSRSSSGVKEPTDINKLADEYLRLAYHGLRAKDKSFNATMKTDYDETISNINIIPQDIGRVVLNLINNAFYAVGDKKKSPHPLKGSEEYEPVVTVSTRRLGTPLGDGGVLISVRDNGPGIPKKILDKIFQPFFTTKPTGQGTGLGLSLSYDIVKAHGGELKVETKEGEGLPAGEAGSEFIILLPNIN